MTLLSAIKTISASGTIYLCILLATSGCHQNVNAFQDPAPVNEGSANEKPDTEPTQSPELLTVLAPKLLRPQSDYYVIISLGNSQVPASVDIQLTGARDSNREQTEAKSALISSGETQTLKFTIGDWPSAEYILNVTAQAIDRSWSWTHEKALEYQKKSYSSFIQTDKAIYKPGQLVQFRAIFLQPVGLTPLVLKDGEISVSITDPKRNLIKQWEGLSNYRGLLSLELQLSDDPMLGLWTITVEARGQQVSKQFKVAEYILPTFDVSIRLPNYVTYNEPDLVATVEATYTYGKPVNGHVTLTVQPLVRFSSIDTRPLQQSQYRARIENGTADINVDLVKDLRLERELFEREIEFFALVEEDLTGRKYNQSKIIKMHDRSIKIELLNKELRFKPGLEHLVQLKVAYQDDTPVEDNGPEVELLASIRGKALEAVKLRPVGGIVEHSFAIPKSVEYSNERFKEDSIYYTPDHVELKGVYRNLIYYLDGIDAIWSESRQFMQISLPQLQARNRRNRKGKSSPNPSIRVDEDLKVLIKATENMNQINCQGIARGNVVWATSPNANNKTEFEFEVKIDQRMSPEMRILCFYVRPENEEIIADSIKVPISGLIKNSVRLSASHEVAKPGQEVELTVQTKPNSLVGVLGVDQSVLLLRSGNDISQKDVTDEVKSFGTGTAAKGSVRNAEDLIDEAGLLLMTNNMIYHEGSQRFGQILRSSALDPRYSKSALRSDSILLGNLIQEDALTPPEFHLNKRNSEPLVIRTLFPETWIWQNASIGSDGSHRIRTKVPDTITSWALTAFSMNEAQGFGLTSQPTNLRVFRPFFIKLNLPYSIIRGEIVNIQAVIFNYSKRPTSARVTLENRQGDFEFVEAANNIENEKYSSQESESRLVRIPANDGASVSFLIKPVRSGHIDIRMVAQGDFAGDGVVKKLLVKPEGQTQHLNKAIFINLPQGSSQQSHNVTINVPVNAVQNSTKVFVSAVGDIMGAGLSNVDDLLRLPYGCGEQNMINLVPNIVIYNYLLKTRRLNEAQRAKAIKNIETGYQTQLNYKRPDGSFSAFGPSDANGSVWLTAYVLKTLQQASSIITVDEQVVRRAANYLARHSRSDGSIIESGMLHDKRLQSAGASDTSSYLTAYTMIALMEKPIKPDGDYPAPVPLDEVLDRGLTYLESRIEEAARKDSPYELSIITYALHLANRRQEVLDSAYDALQKRARQNGDQTETWWENRGKGTETEDEDEATSGYEGSNTFEGEASSSEKLQADQSRRNGRLNQRHPIKPIPINIKHSAHSFLPDSLAIEMTSLALLTVIRRKDMNQAVPIVKWLTQKQNSNGGFASTQDTVLALEAIAKYAELSMADNSLQSVDLEILYPRERPGLRRNNVDQMLLSKQNSLVSQQLRLPDNASWVKINANGVGSAVVQVFWQYNILVSAEMPSFYLNLNLDRSSNVDYLQLSICTYYKAGDISNMALVEVELPSGYRADVETLPGLKRVEPIKRVDSINGDTKVVIYLDRVTRDEICFTVPAHRITKVANNRPVAVSIYDYYDRSKTARIFYEPPVTSSCDICDSEECRKQCSLAPNSNTENFKSLHHQRNIKTPRLGNLSLNADSPELTLGGVNATQLLPLTPVIKKIKSAMQLS